MKEISIVHLGPGKVGKTFIHYFGDNKKEIGEKYNVKLNFVGIFDSNRGYINYKGIDLTNYEKKMNRDDNCMKIIKNIKPPFILVDTTASSKTHETIKMGLQAGGFAVMSNKKPMSENIEIFDYLNTNKTYFETTVGAGLPIISTIKELLDTGDKIERIQGCFSGTLGYIFSLLQNGVNFSEAVVKAKNNGYTEPDPRDDLSGMDVARKGLILNRILGGRLSLEDIKLPVLYPPEMNKLSVDDFMKNIVCLDDDYINLNKEEKEKKETIRYVVDVDKEKCLVEMKRVDLSSDIGGLNGPDNICVIKTRRYDKYPLVVKGPGAGLGVTATGVLGDLIKAVKIMSI